MPQVQRVGHGAELHQRFAGQQPVGCREAVPCGRPGSAVGPGQDEQRRGADRHQRPRSRELLDAVDERPAGQDGRQAHTGQQGAQPHRPADIGHQRAHQNAQQQFPGPGEAVVVGADLVGLMGDDRVDERGHRENGQQCDEGGAQPSAAQPPEGGGESQNEQQERDVELTLHRHRPDVLQRRDGLTGAQVVRRRGRQFPVLVVAQTGQALVGEGLPPGLRLNQNGQHRRGGQDRHQRR